MLDATTMSEACDVDGCNHAAVVRGLCARHHDEERILEKLIRKKLVRTFKRSLTLMTRLPPEMIANYIFPDIRIDQVADLIVSLEEVARCIGKKMQWKCAECGKDIWFKDDLPNLQRVIQRKRRNSRYCSQACRQRAYRKRVTATPSDTKAKASRVMVIPSRGPA
jgi:hypothetical protein